MKKSNNFKMKSHFMCILPVALLSASTILFGLYGCSGDKPDGEIETLKKETIAVHDEIMPQISSFDRMGIKIDSILINLDSLKQADPNLDTVGMRTTLQNLKYRLEGATDGMMTWMMEFNTDPEDMTEEQIKAYYESELAKIKNMKVLFDEVSKESADKLSGF